MIRRKHIEWTSLLALPNTHTLSTVAMVGLETCKKLIMKKMTLGIAFISLCLYSCSDPNKDKSDFLYQAHITKVEDSIACSDLIDSVSYIKLETNDRCRIGEVNQLLVANKKLYVISNGIHCFDLQGHHLFSINQRGHAKNEYVEIRNVNIIDDKLFLYDNKLAKVLIFNSNSGIYIDCMLLPCEMVAAYGLKEQVIIDRGSIPQEMLKGDGRFILCPQTDVHDTSKGYFSEDEHRFVIEGTTSTCSRGIIYSSYLNCMAWKLTDNGCKGYLKLDVPSDMKLPESVINRAINDRRLPDDTDGYIYGLSNIAESDDFITGRLSYAKNFAYFIYDKRSGNTRCYSNVSEKELWQFAPISFQYGDKESLFNIYSSDEILLIRNIFGTGTPPSDRNLHNYEIYCSEEESDNPVVARFYLKHF